MLDHFITTSDAASLLDLHPETIKRFCRQGRLNGHKINNGWIIPRDEIDRFAETYQETRGRPKTLRVRTNGVTG